MDNSIFCRDCGCEILSELDLGFADEDFEVWPIFAGSPTKQIIAKKFYICAACKDEEERRWEDFTQTPEYQYECSFERFCRQFDDDAYFREVSA